MDKRALWSKILTAVALTLMGVGFMQITAVGRRAGFWFLAVLGIIVAAAGAILSKSSCRKIILWGAGGTAAAMAPGFILGLISGLRGNIGTPDPHPVIVIMVLVGILSQIAIVVGGICILAEPKRPASPPNPGS